MSEILAQAQQVTGVFQEWNVEDDLCDCVYQRIGYWFNPYIGETLEVRMCCIWAELYKAFPQFVRTTQVEPIDWNGEATMPESIWHRHLAAKLDISVSEARNLNLPTPRGRSERPVIWLPFSGDWIDVRLGR